MRRPLTVLLTLFVTSCATLVEMPPISREVSAMDADSAWAAVLGRFVDDQGRVDFEGVRDRPDDLHVYVRYVSQTSPKRQPDRFALDRDRLAFYINSYNALSMYNILDTGIPDTLAALRKIRFFFLKKLVVGGEALSLYKYENEIIRKLGDERIHFALNCMSAGCPRLPRKPFTAKGLDAELNAEAHRFFGEERNVRVDAAARKVYLSEILKFYTEDFLRKSPNLIAYANRYRSADKKLPEDYEVEFIAYDWTVNIQPAPRIAKR